MLAMSALVVACTPDTPSRIGGTTRWLNVALGEIVSRFENIVRDMPAGTLLPPELESVCDYVDRTGYPLPDE